MTVYSQTAGQRVVASISLADTSEVDLVTSDTSSTSTLESIMFTNTTAGSINVDLIYDKGGSSVYVLHEKPVAAHDYLLLTDHNLPIPAGCLLRVKASAAGVDVTAVHIRNHANLKSIGPG